MRPNSNFIFDCSHISLSNNFISSLNKHQNKITLINLRLAFLCKVFKGNQDEIKSMIRVISEKHGYQCVMFLQNFLIKFVWVSKNGNNGVLIQIGDDLNICFFGNLYTIGGEYYCNILEVFNAP